MNILGCQLALAGFEIHGYFSWASSGSNTIDCINITFTKKFRDKTSFKDKTAYYTISILNNQISSTWGPHGALKHDHDEVALYKIVSDYISMKNISELSADIMKARKS